MKFAKLSLAVAALVVSTSGLAQSVAGDASTAYVKVPTTGSNVPGMPTGKAGVSMPRTAAIDPTLQSYVVGFAAGPIAQTNAKLAGGYGNAFLNLPGTSTLISETWRYAGPNGTDIYAYRQISAPAPNFPYFGGEVIAKVSGQEVYFGEWAPPGGNNGTTHDANLNMTDSRRTVFYVGENPTASMPTLINAKYDVVGIRRYNPDTHTGVHTGVLTANYGGASGTLTGTVWSANFSGTTIASNGTFQNSSGTIKGRFYGTNASALAGIYNPSGHANDMAFGGAKRP
ncbi:Slam-dependent surface lipoprotein [Thauera butanivorans]|uniref:Slam-dependent surface lipoprotein n=1 Tax=Thauera butanivorans TaxID=86174 RepID=UPI003AB8E277